MSDLTFDLKFIHNMGLEDAERVQKDPYKAIATMKKLRDDIEGLLAMFESRKKDGVGMTAGEVDTVIYNQRQAYPKPE